MPRPKTAAPAYSLHRTTGQARVRIHGRDFYLGPHGSPESKQRYAQLLADYFAAKPGAERGANGNIALTVSELVLRYDDFARTFYVKDGHRTDERYRAFIAPLVELYGRTPAAEFGPRKLQAVRDQLIARGNARTAMLDDSGAILKAGQPLARKYVNALMMALVRMFKWAVAQEFVPSAVHDALRCVDGLRKGKAAGVRETAAISPVPEADVWAVVAVCPPAIAAMIQVQYWAGGRPDEITIMRPCDIDRSSTVWSYRPHSHKVEGYDIEREVLLGPRTQAVLAPWLLGRADDAYLFSPRETAEANAKALEARRKKRSSKPVPVSLKRRPRDHYDDASYRQAVVRACRRAGVALWTPGQLRHNAATRVRVQHGAEAAQLFLGHRHLSTTEIYAQRDRKKYLEITLTVG